MVKSRVTRPNVRVARCTSTVSCRAVYHRVLSHRRRKLLQCDSACASDVILGSLFSTGRLSHDSFMTFKLRYTSEIHCTTRLPFDALSIIVGAADQLMLVCILCM